MNGIITEIYLWYFKAVRIMQHCMYVPFFGYANLIKFPEADTVLKSSVEMRF